MSFMTIVEAAMQLGVVPVLILFLVYQLHLQNRRLTDVIARQEEDNRRLLTIIVEGLIAGKSGEPGGGQ